MLSLSRTAWSRKGILMVLVTAKLKNRKSTILPWTFHRYSRSLSERPTFNAWTRCRKRVDALEEHYKWIHDRFQRDSENRESHLKIGWTEQKCIEMDKLAQEDHTYRLSRDVFKRFQGQWYLTLNKSGKNAPMPLRSDFRAAVSFKNRLHQESGEEVAQPISPPQNRKWHSSSSDSCGTGTRPKAGGAHKKRTIQFIFCLLQ